jgi:hypothetical protein
MTAQHAAGDDVRDVEVATEPDDLDSFSDDILAEIDESRLPVLVNAHQMNRRQRAELLRKVQELIPRTAVIEAALKTGDAAKVDQGVLAEFLADTEDVMATVAVSQEQFRAWALTAGDMELLGLFARFTKSFTVGEAPSSSR